MRVRFISGPHAGEARHVERSSIVDLLCDAGVLEHAPLVDPPKPVEPRQVRWAVGPTRVGGVAIFLTTLTGEVLPYQGLPERAAAAFERVHATVPPEILEQYKRQYAAAYLGSAARSEAM